MTTLAIVAAVTRALGHANRLRALAMLRAGPLSVCHMAAVMRIPVSTMSGHLVELRRAGLVREQRRGKWVYYRLTNLEPLTSIVAPVLAAIADDPQIRSDVIEVGAQASHLPATACDEATWEKEGAPL